MPQHSWIRKQSVPQRKLDCVQRLLKNQTYQADSKLYLMVHRDLMCLSLSTLMGLETIQGCK